MMRMSNQRQANNERYKLDDTFTSKNQNVFNTAANTNSSSKNGFVATRFCNNGLKNIQNIPQKNIGKKSNNQNTDKKVQKMFPNNSPINRNKNPKNQNQNCQNNRQLTKIHSQSLQFSKLLEKSEQNSKKHSIIIKKTQKKDQSEGRLSNLSYLSRPSVISTLGYRIQNQDTHVDNQSQFILTKQQLQHACNQIAGIQRSMNTFKLQLQRRVQKNNQKLVALQGEINKLLNINPDQNKNGQVYSLFSSFTLGGNRTNRDYCPEDYNIDMSINRNMNKKVIIEHDNTKSIPLQFSNMMSFGISKQQMRRQAQKQNEDLNQDQALDENLTKDLNNNSYIYVNVDSVANINGKSNKMIQKAY